MSYEKQFNEIYAITALSYFWQDYQPGFRKSESPDWLNPEIGIGIEVSQALLPQDGQEERFIETYLGKRQTEIPPEASAKYGERLYFYNQRLWALLPAESDTATTETKILYRIDRKTAKLNKNYHNCSCNGLYLFTHGELTQDQAEMVFHKVLSTASAAETRFDIIFLDCKTTIYLLDFKQKQVQTIPIPEKAYRFLYRETELLRNSKTWQNGDIFTHPIFPENS